MLYHSTRAAQPSYTFEQILIEGLAPDGGLMVPASYPQLSLADLQAWRQLRYEELAFEIMHRYWPELPAATLRARLSAAYGAQFDAPDVVPVTSLIPGELYLLGLSEGPTLAFKDIAMQFLGQAFEQVLMQRKQFVNILGATSGDTGSAAEYAMRGREGIAVFMLSPRNRMSAFQRAQMYSLQDPNIHNLTIDGTFDECQDLVKAVNQDADFKAAHHIAAVNSINWGRIVAQVVYYVWTWLRITRTANQKLSFTVPSGNFGNVLAGHIAKQMGLPIERLVVATNENDVLDVFFRTGRYEPRSPAMTHTTSSPSMDISKASNFERFVFDLLERDPVKLASLWRKLETEQAFDLSKVAAFGNVARFGMVSGRSTHADRVHTIGKVFRECQQLIDPHTADGVFVAQKFIDSAPMVVLETAKPVKFGDIVIEATGCSPARPKALQNLESLPQRTIEIAATPAAVRAQIEALGLR